MSEEQSRPYKVYQRKDDGKEESKGERTSYRGGRGGRGGTNNIIHQGDRPKTSNGERGGAKPHYQRRKEGATEGNYEGEGGDHREQRDRAPKKDLDTNSWVYKFQHGSRPTFEQVVVTLETEVPPIIDKALRLKEPSREEYEKKMKDLDAKIQAIRDKINSLSNKKKETREGGKVQGSQLTFREVLNQKIEEIKGLRDQKKMLYNEKNSIGDKIKALELEREQLLKNLPNNKDMQDPVKIQAKIAELERRYETTSLPPQEEKKLIAEIKRLKDSIQNAVNAHEVRPKLDVLYNSRKSVTEKINQLKPTLEEREYEIDSIRKQLTDDQEQREDVKDKLTKFDDDITLAKAELQKTFDLKDTTREEHFKARYEFQIQNDEIKFAERIAREKQRLIDNEKLKQERIDAKKKLLADRPNPYLKEIETCDRLNQYCLLLKKKVGLIQTEEVIKEEQKAIINEMAREEMQKKVKDGKIQQVMSKKEREEAAVIKVGARKQKQAPVQVEAAPVKKQHQEEQPDVFTNPDITLLKLFTLIKVSPPTDKSQLDPKIDEINAKLAFYTNEGEKRLKEEEEKLLAGELVEEEEVKEHYEEDFGGKGGYRGGRGGRGGFRGGRGGRGGNFRTGTAAGTRKPRENADEDIYVSSDDEATRVSKATAGGRRNNKKEDLNLDDNNYPTL